MTDSAALTNRTTVAALVAVFAAAEADVRAAFASLVAAQERLDAAFTLGGRYQSVRIDATCRGSDDSFEDPERCIERMRRGAWAIIVQRLELSRVLSIARHAALLKSIDTDDPLPITEENVVAFVQRFATDIPAMWQEAVKEVDAWLRPWPDSFRAGYKTNEKNARLEIGPKVVLTGVVERAFSGSKFRVCFHSTDKLAALARVFAGLDGNGQVGKTHRGPLVDAIEASADGHARTEYFEVRAYKAGTLHVTFLRRDLLQRFNALAGGLRLRPAESAA